jgi:hypothetical protein
MWNSRNRREHDSSIKETQEEQLHNPITSQGKALESCGEVILLLRTCLQELEKIEL